MAKKILVIRLSSLGDIVLTFPILDALRHAYPEADIVPLVKDSFADAVAGRPEISRVMVLRAGESLGSLVKRVRAEHFDTVLDLHANLRSRVISLFSGAEQVARYRKAGLARRLYVRWRFPSAELERHTLERYWDALRQLDPLEPRFHKALTPLYQPRSILLVQTAFLGDAVLTTPLVHTLHEAWPSVPVTVLATPETEEIFRRQAGVREVLLYDKRGKDRSVTSLPALVRRLREKRFDLAILPHRSFKSALLTWLAGIPRRVGFSRSQGRWLLTDVVPFEWGVHDAERNLALLKGLGVQPSSVRLSMTPDPEATRRVDYRLRAAGIQPGERLLGIHAGSVWATKRWLPERFAALADRAIRELGARVVFVGGPKDRDAMNQLTGNMNERCLNWVGETTLKELIAVIARCKTFLTNDSGPMHIAVACGVPTVAIFGPTTRELGFFPYGPGHQVIEKELACRPCGLHGSEKCPLGHFECMKSITVGEVFDAIKGKLT